MMKRLTLILLSAFICITAAASSPKNDFPRITFGIEWGYSATVFTSYHFNYICSEGYRLDNEGRDFIYHSNGDIIGTFGVNILDWLRIGLFSGYEGISEDRRIIPVGAKLTVCPDGYIENGVLFRIGGGMGISPRDRAMTTSFGIVGFGYHVALTRESSIDFILGYKAYIDHPPVEDIDGGYVSERDTRKNIATYHALNFSISLNF